MKRMASYGDPRINPYSHPEHKSDPKLPIEIGANKYTRKSDIFHTQEQRTSHPSDIKSHWQMSHSGYHMSNKVPSYPLHVDQENSVRRSYHQGHAVNPSTTTNFEKLDNRDAAQHEEDMDIGYGDTPPVTFDGLERKFNDEILRLVKEQSDLEDAEITRHKERLMEINTQYQQQLLSVRTRQAAQRQEFLQKESDARHYQYQRPGIQEYPNSLTTGDFHQYSRARGVPASVAAGGVAHQYDLPAFSVDATGSYGNTAGEAARGYREPQSQIESSYGERGYRGNMKTSDASGRVPYPEGRVYNTGSRYH